LLSIKAIHRHVFLIQADWLLIYF